MVGTQVASTHVRLFLGQFGRRRYFQAADYIYGFAVPMTNGGFAG